MNTSSIYFEFTDNHIRVVNLDGEPWFVAKDCAVVLGFTTTAGANWYTRHLDSDELNTITLTRGSRGNPRKVVVSESGLYKLIMRSDKPEARKFQDWVTGTVLPAIRKDGGYIMCEEKLSTGEMTENEFLAKALQVATSVLERTEAENKATLATKLA